MKPFYEDNLERIDDVKHCLLSEERATIIEPAHIDVVKNGQLWNQPCSRGTRATRLPPSVSFL